MVSSSSTLEKEIPLSQPGAKESYSDDESDYGGITPTRHSNESSPAASVYDFEGASVAPTLVGDSSSSNNSSSPIKELSLFFSRTRRSILIVLGAHSAKDTDPEEAATYHVKTSIHKHDVTVAKVSTDEIIGVCRMRSGFKTYTIGLGDPDSATTTWEAMKRHGVFATRHWEFSVPVGELGKRRKFSWKRTHNKATSAAASLKNKKLVDEESGQIVALYLVNGFKSWKKQGKLLIFRDYGEIWELMTLVSLLGLLDQARRRRAAAG
jgi:hypothetical protein